MSTLIAIVTACVLLLAVVIYRYRSRSRSRDEAGGTAGTSGENQALADVLGKILDSSRNDFAELRGREIIDETDDKPDDRSWEPTLLPPGGAWGMITRYADAHTPATASFNYLATKDHAAAKAEYHRLLRRVAAALAADWHPADETRREERGFIFTKTYFASDICPARVCVSWLENVQHPRNTVGIIVHARSEV